MHCSATSRERQPNREIGPRSGRALDHQPTAVAIEDMLDEGEAQAGAALSGAFSDIDAIKPLGKSRQMFWCDTGPVVSHRHDRVPRLAGRGFARHRDVDPLAGCAIFQGILDQVFEYANEFVAISQNVE